MNPSIISRAKKIKLLILDVDGVLTDGTLYFTEQGETIKTFYVGDGYGILQLQEAGVAVAMISGRQSAAVAKRAAELKLSHLYQGCTDKLTAYEELLQKCYCSDETVAYAGDDIPDLNIMERVGFAIAVANAHPTIKARAHWQTTLSGGKGAVREICDLLLQAREKS